MDKVVINIFDDDVVGVNLAVDAILVQEYFPFEERLMALERANKRLDADLRSIYSAFDNDSFRAYACSITDDNYLTDTFRSGRKNTMIWYYYLVELIELIRESVVIDYIIVDSYYVSREFVRVLQASGLRVKTSLACFLLINSINYAYGIKYCRQLLYLLLGVFSKKPEMIEGGKEVVLIDMPIKEGDNRYGGFLDKIQDEYCPVYLDIKNGIFLQNGKQYSALSFFCYGHIFRILKEFFAFRRAACRTTKKINTGNLIFEAIKSPNFILFVRNAFLLTSLRELYKQKQVRLVFIRSMFNHNLKRMYVVCAKEILVPCVCFLPRTLTPSKPAERSILDNIGGAGENLLADFYQITDSNSLNTMVAQGFSSDTIILSERTERQSLVPDKNADSGYNFSVILILGGKKRVNEKLISTVASVLAKFPGVLVSVRAHPLKPLRKEDKRRLSAQFNCWFDSTGKPYEHVPAKYKVVISTASTATVEAAKAGCGVVWCPYMEEESLLMFPIMRKFGKVVTSDKELTAFLGALFEREDKIQSFVKACELEAKKEFAVGTSLEEGYAMLKQLVQQYQNKHG